LLFLVPDIGHSILIVKCDDWTTVIRSREMRSIGHLLFRSAGQSDGLVTNSHSYVLFPMEDVVYGLSFCFKFDICAEGCSDKCQHFWRGCRFEHIAEQGDNLDDRLQVILLFGEYPDVFFDGFEICDESVGVS
jgi:hypothetical protein